MKYCKRCIIPDTRPNISLNSDGICNACEAHSTRKIIDWGKRKEAFIEVVENAKSRSNGYDCLIPVSGGKDSTWQVVTCLKYGLKPLAVTWKTPVRTTVGKKNLENLINLGVDHIDYQINPKVEKKFILQSLAKYGTPAIPMHMAIFNIPLKIAVKFDIPLVVWGENSAFEYGGTEEEQKGFKLDGKWLKKFGVTHDTKANDWISKEISEKDLTPYFGPDDKELEKKGIVAIFLGYFFQWDPDNILNVASEHGFQASMDGPKTGFYNYADIDDDFISIHHYIKWYKFGFTRLFDNLSIEIRNGRISREDAVKIVKEKVNITPHEDINEFCKYMNISRQYFFEIIEKFRNLNIWKKEENVWKIPDFLISDWNWT